MDTATPVCTRKMPSYFEIPGVEWNILPWALSAALSTLHLVRTGRRRSGDRPAECLSY